MREYELTREIFNKCSGNQMRDVYIEELELDENGLESYVKNYFSGRQVEIERRDEENAVVFEITIAGQLQRMTFCEI